MIPGEFDILQISYFPEENVKAMLVRISDVLNGVQAENYQDIYISTHYAKYGKLYHAVSHECMRRFANQLTFIDSDRSTRVSYLDMEPFLQKERLFQICRDLILSGNYSAAGKVLQTRPMGTEMSRLLSLADALIRFTPEQAKPEFNLLADVLERYHADQEAVAFCRGMQKLCEQDAGSVITYLYNISEFYYEQEQLVEFFVYYYRLVEEWVLYAMGWDVGYGNELRLAKGREFSLPLPRERIQTYLHHYIRVLRNERYRLARKYRSQIDRTNWKNLPLSEQDRAYIEICMFLTEDRFNELLELRHEGVSGHGFEDFTLKECIELCGGIPPLEKLDPMLARWGVKPEHNIIQLLNHALLSVLDEALQ